MFLCCTFSSSRLFPLQLSRLNAAAGQRNQSAIHYHFGSRDGILDAIMDLRVPPMNQARAALLERMRDEAGARPLTSREIVTALIQPNLDRLLATPGPHFTARLLLQMRVDAWWCTHGTSDTTRTACQIQLQRERGWLGQVGVAYRAP